MLPLSTLEEELTRQGYFSLFDWLLSCNRLGYGDYESWRYRRLSTLEGRFQLDTNGLDELIHTAESHALSLGLTARQIEYFDWDAGGEALRLCDSEQRHRALSLRWERPLDIPQMDLFLDNSASIAENALIEALSGRRWETADETLRRLTRLDPASRRLGGYNDLLNYGHHVQANRRLDKDAIGAELEALRGEVVPLARELLGRRARDYLGFAWRRLADNLQDFAFDPARPELHASHALAQIPDWQALEQCLNADPQLRRHPRLLEWLAECLAVTARPAQSSGLWCTLFDRYPEYAEAALERSRDHPVYRIWEAFWEAGDDWRPTDFTGFMLIGQPGLLTHAQKYASLQDEANLAVAELLRHRAAGLDEVAARRRLQQISPSLFEVYLRRRST